METKMDCIYTSGLVIEQPELVSTLSIFYDKIQLPHAYDIDPDAKDLMRWPFDKLYDLELYQKDYVDWKNKHKELFDAGILEVLPPSIDINKKNPNDLSERLLNKLGNKVPFFNSSQVFSGRLAIAVHALFSKTSAPEFILANSKDTSTEHLQQVLLSSLLTYQIPTIGQLESEQILEIRDRIKDYRKGFLNYINQHLDEVENRIHTSNVNENEATKRTIERTISPDYEEFILKELPSKIKWWSSAIKNGLSILGGSLKIFAAPWSLGNYIDPASNVSELVGLVGSKAENDATNRHKAFQLISKIEKGV